MTRKKRAFVEAQKQAQDETDKLKSHISNAVDLLTSFFTKKQERESDTLQEVTMVTNEQLFDRVTKYTNVLKPELNFEQSFQAFQEFSLNQGPIQTQEQKLLALIIRQLTEDIFNKAFANW